jgi:transcriptional regulator with GAF, ATPase, and Fis domain
MTDPTGDRLLGKLREVIGKLAEDPHDERLVEGVLDRAIELTGAERGFVLAVAAAPGAPPRFEIAAARNLDRKRMERPEFQLSRTVVERVIQSGSAELVSDAAADERTKRVTSVKNLQLRSILCVPLRLHGQTLGVVYVDNRSLRGGFDAAALATLETFAVPAAILLDSARRLRELSSSREELARRVEIIERLRAELASRYREQSREVDRLRARELGPDAAPAELPGLVARSPSMRRVVELARKAAPTEAPVLIHGESGVGKEILARALHALSPRREGPFYAENCGALADTLLESALFGHEPGAFTGAVHAQAGIFEASRGGTLFLDEVGETSPSLQTKLLRVIQEREVRRLGGRTAIPVDVRLVAATHRNLEAMVAKGEFRADLYYRLNVVRIEVPPLRERPEDASILIDRLERRHEISLEPQTRELLLAWSWPGNVRELENELLRLSVVVGRGGTARPAHLSPAILGRPPAATASSDEPPLEGVWALKDLEKVMIERALRKTQGNRSLAARLLGLPKSSLYDRMQKHGLHGVPESTG